VLFPENVGTKDFAHKKDTKAPKARRLAGRRARSLAGHLAGSPASGRWRFRASAHLSPPGQSWQP